MHDSSSHIMMCSGLLTSSDKSSPYITHMDMNIQCHVYVHAHRIIQWSGEVVLNSGWSEQVSQSWCVCVLWVRGWEGVTVWGWWWGENLHTPPTLTIHTCTSTQCTCTCTCIRCTCTCMYGHPMTPQFTSTHKVREWIKLLHHFHPVTIQPPNYIMCPCYTHFYILKGNSCRQQWYNRMILSTF